MTEQLKPCPFCGGAAHFFKITDLDEKNFGGEGICCGSCPITTDLMFSLMEDCKPKLAEAWNRRAQPAQAVPVLTDAEIDTAYEKARADYQRSRFAVRGQQLTAQDSPDWWFARAIEQAVRAKLGAGVGWQPISTAPKTSKAILVYCAERKNIYTANYGKVGGFLQADGWRHFGNGGDMTEAPSHWMPLPPPPGIVGKEGA